MIDPTVRWQRPDDLVGFGPRLLEFVSEMINESMTGYGEIVTIGEAAVPGGGERLTTLVSARGEQAEKVRASSGWVLIALSSIRESTVHVVLVRRE